MENMSISPADELAACPLDASAMPTRQIVIVVVIMNIDAANS